MSGLTAAGLELFADLSGLNPGRYNLPVRYQSTGDVTIIARRAGEPRRHDPLMAPRLFGTDGVRGHAGQWPLDPATVRRLGASIVRVLDPSSGPARLLIGRDTRESGTWIERELAYGASLSGASVIAAGVLPTPAVAYLTRSSDVTLGAIISASHNPFEDNGIKVFSGGGQKFTEELERRVEHEIADTGWSLPDGDAPALVADRSGRRVPAITCARCCPTPAACEARRSSWTAPTARPPAWPRRCLPISGSTSI